MRGPLTCIACGREACAHRYPVVEGVPVMVANAEQHLARQYLALRARVVALRERAEQHMRVVELESEAAADHVALAEAYEANAGFLQTLADSIAAHVSRDHIADLAGRGPHDPFGSADPLLHVVRDYAGTADTEAAIATVRELAADAIARVPAPHADTLVLGAGAGRVACEMPGERVIAVDDSLAMALSFERIRRGGVVVYDVLDSGRGTRRDRAMRADASAVFAAKAGPARDRVEYVVCDARALPIADRSTSLVMSAFFSDVLPLRAMLREVARVLRPGGMFVHHGPLAYHFDDPGQTLTPDEVRATCAELGFRIVHESWAEVPFPPRTTSFRHATFHVWTFIAERLERSASVKPTTVLTLRGGILVETHALISNDSHAMLRATLRSSAGTYQTDDSVLVELVQLVDGASPFDDLLQRLAEAGHVPADRDALVRRICELVELGFLHAAG